MGRGTQLWQPPHADCLEATAEEHLLPFTSETADHLTIRRLEEFPQPIQAVMEAKRVLRHGGAVEVFLGEHSTRPQVEKLLEAAGFKEVRCFERMGETVVRGERP